MCPSAFLIAICAIVISANASSTEKRQLDSSPDICKDTLRQSLARSKQAKMILRKADLGSNNGADIINQELTAVIENLLSTGKYCCKNTGVDVSSKDDEDIYTIFNDYYRIRYYIRPYNRLFKQSNETKQLIANLHHKDCKKHFNKSPHIVGLTRDTTL